MTAHLAAAGLDRLHDAMNARVARRELPGLVTLLSRGDEVHIDTIGRHGFDNDELMRRDTIFRIGSLTKPVVAVATMMLVEDGTISLDEPADRLLPEVADRLVLNRLSGALDDTVPSYRAITVDDLLTLRLGFGQITEPEFDPPYPIVTAGRDLELVLGPPDPRTPHHPDEWMARFGSLPLMEQPGERWRYNVGTLLLGVLIARAVEEPLGEMLRRRIFEPLGMADTGFATTPSKASRLPDYYMSDGGTGQPVLQPHSARDEWTTQPAFPSASGGLLATVDDFFAFARMLRDRGRVGNARLLREESVAAMTTNHLTASQIRSAGVVLDGQGWGYGLGVITNPTREGMTPGQYGWSGGYGTTWFNDPSRDLTAIAFSQTSDFLWNGGLHEFDALAVAAAS